MGWNRWWVEVGLGDEVRGWCLFRRDQGGFRWGLKVVVGEGGMRMRWWVRVVVAENETRAIVVVVRLGLG